MLLFQLCCLLISFAFSLDPDQTRQCFHLKVTASKDNQKLCTVSATLKLYYKAVNLVSFWQCLSARPILIEIPS